MPAWEDKRRALKAKHYHPADHRGASSQSNASQKIRRHHQQRNKNFRFQRKFLDFLSSPRDWLFGDGPRAWKIARSSRSGPEWRNFRPFGASRKENFTRRSQVNKEKKFLGNACRKARPKWNSIGNVSDNVRRTEMVFGARWRQSRRLDD